MNFCIELYAKGGTTPVYTLDKTAELELCVFAEDDGRAMLVLQLDPLGNWTVYEREEAVADGDLCDNTHEEAAPRNMSPVLDTAWRFAG